VLALLGLLPLLLLFWIGARCRLCRLPCVSRLV